MSKKRMIVCASTAIIALLVVAIGIFATRQSADTPDRLLNLGEKYLTELNYEQALVQFLKVIEIDPMNPRGYTGAAEAYVGLGENDSAIAVLIKGMHLLPNDVKIKSMLEELQLPVPEESPIAEMELKQHEEETEQNQSGLQKEIAVLLSELLIKYESDGHESLFFIFETTEYKELIEKNNEYPAIYVDSARNYGIGVYSSVFVYIGGYTNLERNGYGIWVQQPNDYFKFWFEGEWADDLPHGAGNTFLTVGEIESHIHVDEAGMTTFHSLEHNTSGTYINGLVNGTYHEQILWCNGHICDYYFTSANGIIGEAICANGCGSKTSSGLIYGLSGVNLGEIDEDS